MEKSKKEREEKKKIETMRRYDSRVYAAEVCVIIVAFYMLSQIKLSSFSSIRTAISTKTDQGRGFAPLVSSPLVSSIRCDRSHGNYDQCSINAPNVLDPKTSTFYVTGTHETQTLIEKLRPYPHKNSSQTMDRINEITLTSGPPAPSCGIQHNAPALVFSVGGYTWNFFHAFIDGFIPLFITINTVYPDQDLVLVITNAQDWWVRKYVHLFRSFSKHPIVFLDNDTSTHCFTSTTVGLISHGFMTIDSEMIPNKRNTLDFHKLLSEAYCSGDVPLSPIQTKRRPRLVLLSRTGGVGRVILNQGQVIKTAEEEGFEVVVFAPKQETPLQEACKLMSSSQVVLGVHGAAFTYALFLRPGSVLIQVVGIGLDNVAELCFGRFARDMKFEYVEYKVGMDESTLVDRYGEDDVIVKDPKSLQMGWFDTIMGVYLRQQNVKFNIIKLREYLKRAYEKARIQMQVHDL